MRNCPGCGKELNKDYDFCPYCSYELKEYGEEEKRLDAEFEAMDNDKDLNVRDNKRHISDEENEKLKLACSFIHSPGHCGSSQFHDRPQYSNLIFILKPDSFLAINFLNN